MFEKVNKFQCDLIEQANQNVAEAANQVDHTYRPDFHFVPPAFWINDPNGLVYYQGYYHIFYQHHPYSPEWGPMYWGHARTKDFVNWEHLPIALAPSEDYDRDGCFSGSAIVADGKLHLFYTGHKVVGEDQVEQVQCRAVSEDGITFVKDPANPLIPSYPEAGSQDFRDPKVWRHADNWYMVLGTGKDGIGKALLYKSADLTKWNYVGVLAESDGTQGYIWECPDFFPLGDKYVLLYSPIGLGRRHVRYQIGEMDYNIGKFTAEYEDELDFGPDFYAVQSFSGTKRRIVLAWMDSWKRSKPSQKHNWAGALTLPRELILQEGRIKSVPLKELKALRQDGIHCHGLLLESGDEFCAPIVAENGFEIYLQVDLANTTANNWRISIQDEQQVEMVLIGYDRTKRELVLDTDQSGLGDKGVFKTTVPTEGSTFDLRVFLDRSSVEVFAEEGTRTLTARVYPTKELAPRITTSGGNLALNQLDIWPLAPFIIKR